MLIQIIMYIISFTSIVLGFIALLKQKTYIDSETKEPTEIELSPFGKIRTNYPALVFVFFGFSTAIFAFEKSGIKEKVRWRIQGQIVDTTNKIVDYWDGDLVIIPENTDISIDRNTGAYTIEMDIDKGKSFEDAVNCIIYTHKSGFVQFCPQEELIKKSKGEPSFLSSNTNPTRFYIPVVLPTKQFQNEKDNVYSVAHYVNQ